MCFQVEDPKEKYKYSIPEQTSQKEQTKSLPKLHYTWKFVK